MVTYDVYCARLNHVYKCYKSSNAEENTNTGMGGASTLLIFNMMLPL